MILMAGNFETVREFFNFFGDILKISAELFVIGGKLFPLFCRFANFALVFAIHLNRLVNKIGDLLEVGLLKAATRERWRTEANAARPKRRCVA